MPIGKLILAGILILVFSQSGSVAAKPNFILIMADDLGYGDIGAYGSTVTRTPNLDSLAGAGLKFTDFHSNGPVCSPTRAALMTGQYQQRWGMDDVVDAATSRDEGLSLEALTVAEVLKTAGYATAAHGKWHLGYIPAFNPVRQGFDQYRGFVSGNVDMFFHIDQEGYKDWWRDEDTVSETGYVTHLITQHALNFIDQNRNNPFFLYLPYSAVHYPLQGPNDRGFRRVQPGVSQPLNDPGLSSAELRANYSRMLEALDTDIGLVTAKLKALGLDSNTFIFFCSDNGSVPTYGGSTGPFRGQKGSVLEGGHRVPGIASWPGKIAPGTTTSQTALTMDLFPTFASMAGMTVTGVDGVDLSSVLLSGGVLPGRSLFWDYKQGAAVRRGPWKFVNINGVKSLYNLDTDPGESNPITNQSAVKTSLDAELIAWQQEVVNRVVVSVAPTTAKPSERGMLRRKPGHSEFRPLWRTLSGPGAWRDILGRFGNFDK